MIKQASLALIMRVTGTGFWLIYTIAMARLLPPADFGTLMYAINLALILAPVATLGFESSTLKHAAPYWSEGQFAAFAGMLRQSRRMACAGGMLCWAALVLGALWGVASPVTQDVSLAHLTGAAIFLAALMGIHRDSLRAADRLIPAFLGLSILRTLLPLAGAGGLYSLDLLSVNTALWAFCAALCVAVGVEYIILSRLSLPAPRLTVSQWRSHRAVAVGTWAGDMAHVVLMRAPVLCLGILTGPEVLALYVAVERIAQLGQFLTDAVRTAAAPTLARACQNVQDRRAIAMGLSDISQLMLKSGGMDAILLTLLAYPALWAMGDVYAQAYPLIFLFIAVQLGWTIPGPTAMAMNMMGLERRRTLWTILAAGLLIAGIFLWVDPHTAWAAIALQCGVVWGLNLWQVWQIRRDRGVWSGVFARWNERLL